MTDPQRILESAKTILLVDWPNPRVPRALLEAGFQAFSYSPGRYSSAEIVTDRPTDMDSGSIFAPEWETEGFLVFRKLAAAPTSVDIVSTFRPAEELPGIVANIVVPVGAKTLWLHSSCGWEDGQSIAAAHGLALVEATDIADVALQIRRTGTSGP